MLFTSRSSLILLNAFVFLAVALLPSGVHLAACLTSPGCGCIERGSFDSDWLEANRPDVFAQYSGYTFSRPQIDYPECSAIIANCMPSAEMVAIYANGTISPTKKSPFSIVGIFCNEGTWEYSGLGGSPDANIKASNVSCRVKN
uniref:C6 domain-containing protein n=1 Tax=Caenorhabditis tropicalis TaxID=1561998 RepID=A0A1I7TCE0_9PELO